MKMIKYRIDLIVEPQMETYSNMVQKPSTPAQATQATPVLLEARLTILVDAPEGYPLYLLAAQIQMSVGQSKEYEGYVSRLADPNVPAVPHDDSYRPGYLDLDLPIVEM